MYLLMRAGFAGAIQLGAQSDGPESQFADESDRDYVKPREGGLTARPTEAIRKRTEVGGLCFF